ncbi:MATE family efflux transporter [Romboutsia timonensis]|uniref:MATE family efflux transporter n=1 Tax=Romboutsia timonensis TaxID=1776391 RepID=UPI002A7F3F74|nr:MATE family efflux transporter [Romboutsia timonensis]MDY3958858.1 MATE family efflux transporter [Romboutsia timonensis]
MVKQFLGYAIPSALAMCIASLNTIIDGVFLGNGIGDAALGAVNIVMPITIVFFGLATMVSVGGGALISKYFGANEDEKGISIFRQVTYMLIIMSICLSAVCVIFSKSIVKIMGATENLQPLSSEYLKYYAMFCLPSLLGIAFNSFLRNDNEPKLAMVSTICGTISNIILNYIFIFKLGLGIKSAAIATGFGQIITLLIALPHFILKKGRLSFGKQNLEAGTIREVLKIGLPSFFAEAAFSVIIFVHNLVLVNTVGEIGISTYAIINYITTNIYLVLLGVTLGAQPLISYNYGTKDGEKMLVFYKLSNRTSIIIGIIFALLCFVFGREIISVFTSDKELINISYIAVNINNLAYLFIGKNLTTTMYYQAIEIPKYSNMICAMRSILILPIVLVIMAKAFGENGIWISMAISEFMIILISKKVFNINKCTENAVANLAS